MTQRKVRADGLLQKTFRMKINGVSKQFAVYGHSEDELHIKELQKRSEIEQKLNAPPPPKTQSEIRLGAIGRNYNNRKMSISAYRNSNDMTVKFEDGVEVDHITYTDFTHGYVEHPEDPKDSIPVLRGVGESRINIQGLRMTIIEWVSDKDISVMFEDGTTVQHKRYAKFGAGCIQNPNVKKITGRLPEGGIDGRIGETQLSTYGQQMTVVAYRSMYDIDVQFEDGTIVKHKRYPLFLKGYITNPNFCKDSITPIRIDQRAYVYEGIPNFYCQCTKCGHKDIMTIDEMKSHICNI